MSSSSFVLSTVLEKRSATIEDISYLCDYASSILALAICVEGESQKREVSTAVEAAAAITELTSDLASNLAFQSEN